MNQQLQKLRAIRRSGAVGLASLSKRRAWFAPEGDGSEGGSGGGAASGGAEPMIPKSRLDEEIQKRVAAETALQKHQTDATAREQETLKEQGRFKDLYEKSEAEKAKLQPYQQRAEELEKRMREGNAKRIEQIPETVRPMVPVQYPPELLATWLDENWSRLTVKPAPDIDAGAGSGAGAVKVTDADRAAAAAASGSGYKVTPEQIAARRAQKTKTSSGAEEK